MPITFSEIDRFQNGAQFHTADLHIHSYGASEDVHDQTMTPAAIVDAAVQHHVSILCITDHNSAENCRSSIEYARGKYAGQIFTLAGVEITTSNGHLLAYFDPDEVDSVQTLLARLDLMGKPGGRDTHTKKSMADVIVEVERLRGICIAAHVDRTKTGFEMLATGYPNWKGDIISSSGLYGLEFDDPANILWFSTEDGCPTNGGERKKLLERRSTLSATAARIRLASIQNSDSHSLQGFIDHSNRQQLTRYKMDAFSFEGLKTALIDSYARVRVEATVPSAIPRILGMHIAGGFLDGDIYRFSDNLNCFIGGRGAGKSTALQSLAYGMGMLHDFDQRDNCPDTIVIYCEDANGIRYRYERSRGEEVRVQCKEDRVIQDVAPDSFRMEFYAQNALSEVAKDPLQNASLLQTFLDKHIILSDLLSREQHLLSDLDHNSGILRPLEVAIVQLPAKRQQLAGLNQKLQIAETGKVREIVGQKSQLAAESTLLESLTAVHKFYSDGISVTNLLRDFDTIKTTAGQLTGDETVEREVEKIQRAVAAANSLLERQRAAINHGLSEQGKAIAASITAIKARHQQINQTLDVAVDRLRKQGLTASIQELNALLKQRQQVTIEITNLEAQTKQADELRARRAVLLEELEEVREEIRQRRKAQLQSVNENLKRTIQDYAVYLYYAESGMTEEFSGLILDVMHGSFFRAEVAESLCQRITPKDLAELIREGDAAKIAVKCTVDADWATVLVEQFRHITNLHRLQVTDKPLKPVFKVLTKTTPAKSIPVSQLSDGQKHTIFLTIAMLAESNVPLIIDQPEDDLDNAFIFTSVVDTLRRIKERRQVLIITHNANIAVLGDSELILPMRRSGEGGQVYDRGSIDKAETRQAAQHILEGGALAFQKRKEIYGV